VNISWRPFAIKAVILAAAFVGGGAANKAVADHHNNNNNSSRMRIEGDGNIVSQTTSSSAPEVPQYEDLRSAQANHRLLGGSARPTGELHFRVPDPVCVRVSWAGRGVGVVCWTNTSTRCLVDERLRPVECSISEKEGTFR